MSYACIVRITRSNNPISDLISLDITNYGNARTHNYNHYDDENSMNPCCFCVETIYLCVISSRRACILFGLNYLISPQFQSLQIRFDYPLIHNSPCFMLSIWFDSIIKLMYNSYLYPFYPLGIQQRLPA